jgi:hypothetical protein
VTHRTQPHPARSLHYSNRYCTPYHRCLFIQCAKWHADHNRTQLAARTYRTVAEIEEKRGKLPEAMKAYEDAAKYFMAQGFVVVVVVVVVVV